MADKLIENETEHRHALAEIERLIESQPAAGSSRSDRIALLALLIRTWEEKHQPIPPPDPVEAILFEIDQGNATRKTLEKALGSSARVAEVLSRKRALSKAMILRLHALFHIPYASLLAPAAAAPKRTSRRTGSGRRGATGSRPQLRARRTKRS